MNILIIDDDASLRYMLAEICKHAGWESVAAENGRKGMDTFLNHAFDLVLVDYHMPEMDGIETVQAIRKQDEQTPILVLTVDERQEIADRFLQEGANDFALKPVKAPDIIARIKLHVQLANLKNVQEQEENPYSAKGISKRTLTHIETFMKQESEAMSVDYISTQVKLAYPTVYRYVMHLLEQGKVHQLDSHQKMGRPKKLYKWYAN